MHLWTLRRPEDVTLERHMLRSHAGAWERLYVGIAAGGIGAVAPIVAAAGAATGGILPFGLGRQAITPAALPGQPLAILGRVVPRHADHRVAV